ncbi:hypothetical protein PMSD_21440 [Paenibacillus macquariensis subsp. defensor]|nr:hypothetical protein PMSD_21440 [Paenibacillus macquariensis subsp. defensor]
MRSSRVPDCATSVEDIIVRPAERKEQLVHAQDDRFTVLIGHSGQPGQIQIPSARFGITPASLLDILVQRLLLLRLVDFQKSDKSIDRLEMFVIQLVIVNGYVQLILNLEHKLDHF